MALTPVGAQVSNSNRNSVEVYRLVNPPSGTGTIQVSLLAAVVNYVVGGGTSYSGVDQTTPNGAFTTARGNSTSPSVVVTDSAAGDLVLDTLAFSPTGGFAGFGAGQTLRWNGRSFFSNAFDIGGGSTKSGVSPVTMSWTISTMDQWVLAGIAIRSLSSTAANSTISGRILTEAGRRPISRTFVTLRNLETGEEVSKISNHFGYYAFENLETGSLYQIQVAHGRYEFSPDILIFRLDESLTDIDFIGSPQDYNNKYPAEKERFR